MQFGLLLVLSATTIVSHVDANPPLMWSPDGRWLACTTVGTTELVIPDPWWLFRTGPVVPPGFEPHSVVGTGLRTESTFRIYAIGSANEGASLIAESRTPLSAPGWSPDGHKLAFERIVTDAAGAFQLEVVVQDDFQKFRVLLSRPITLAEVDVSKFVSTAPSWSPDGRYLAVSQPGLSEGLCVIRADNGRVLKTVEGAFWPAWSPDSARLAFISIRGESATLFVLDESFGPSRQLASIGQTFQPPLWSRDGKSILVVSRKSLAARRGVVSQHTLLVRYQVATGIPETLVQCSADSADREGDFRSVAYSIDRDGDELFYATEIKNQPNLIVWYRPRSHEILTRSHPLETSVRVGSLALSPSGKALAVRFGPAGVSAPVALWDVTENRLTPFVPDDSARVEWLRLLLATARNLLKANLPPTGPSPTRATILPSRGEIPQNREAMYGLRRIGRLGLPLCDRAADAPPAEPVLLAFLAEARLVFDVLRGADREALADLDALDRTTTSPDQRLRLLILRAQLFIGLGEDDRARDVVDFLRTAVDRRRRKTESTSSGVAVTDELSEVRGWAAQLSSAIDLAEKTRGAKLEPNGGDATGRDLILEPPPLVPGLQIPFGRDDEANVFAPAIRRPPVGGNGENQFVAPERPGGFRPPPGPRPPLMPRFQRRADR